eukprot:scaffold79523_cov20-Prasinocladus_malaysianus.AAC.2
MAVSCIAKADGEIRWAVLNTITLLRRYEDVHKKLAEAMLRGVSVGEAIKIIESNLPEEHNDEGEDPDN